MALRRKVSEPNSGQRYYLISVAAELSGMHPQTLRVYERRQLLQPERSSGNTRMYSDSDIDRLRFIQHLTQDEGINLAGVERIIELEDERTRLQRENARLRLTIEEVRRRENRVGAPTRAAYGCEIVLVPRGGMVRRVVDGR